MHSTGYGFQIKTIFKLPLRHFEVFRNIKNCKTSPQNTSFHGDLVI